MRVSQSGGERPTEAHKPRDNKKNEKEVTVVEGVKTGTEMRPQGHGELRLDEEGKGPKKLGMERQGKRKKMLESFIKRRPRIFGLGNPHFLRLTVVSSEWGGGHFRGRGILRKKK